MSTNVTKKQIPVVMAGAGRGGMSNLDAFSIFNRQAIAAELFVAYIDPVSDRAEQLAAEAAARGIKAIGGEEHIEDIVFEGEARPPIILAIDRADAIAQVIKNSEESRQTVAGQLLVKTKQDELFALRWLLRHKDNLARVQALSLLNAMGKISERKGGESVWGEAGRTEHRLLEPVFRESYSQALARDLRKVLFHLEPESHPFEITMDGKTVHPLVVREVSQFSAPTALLEELPSHLYFPFGRGDSLVMAEIADTDIRLQKISRRRTDDRLVLSDISGNSSIAKPDDMKALIDRYVEERVAEETARVEARLARSSLSLTQPVTTTD